MRWGVAVVLALAAISIAPSRAPAAPGMFVGAVENALLWQTQETVTVTRHLGLRSMVVTLGWEPLLAELPQSDQDALRRVVVAAGDIRIVLGIHHTAPLAPNDAAAQDRYCNFVRSTLSRFPQINDIIIWNEPNTSFFWRPQFDDNGASAAPVQYGELLARCYDMLHELRAGINVIGPVNSHWGNDNPNAFSNISHSPPRFIRALGAAYRASGRTRPLFDTLGHHPYPRSSDELPATRHEDEAVVSLGDLDRLLAVMSDAFGGTAQRIPQNGLPIWYLETGYQTLIDRAKFAAYHGDENWPGALPDVAPAGSSALDQASQLTNSLRLMYCQPHVEAAFNFQLRDERDLAGWQSGVFWADGSPKDSYGPFRSAVQEVNERRIACAGGVPAGPPAGTPATAAKGKPPAARPPAGSPAAGTRGADPARTRSITKVTYHGARRVPFGELRLRARLTRGVTRSNDGLAARQVTFVVGRDSYLTTTNADGSASVLPSPPTRPGRHRVAIRFRGDEISLGSAARVRVHVVNSRGRIASRGRLRLSPTLTAVLAVRSNGVTVRGTLTFQRRGVAQKVRLTALGLTAGRRSIWLSGTDGRNRYDVHARRLPSGRLRLQAWRNSTPLHPATTVPAAKLRLSLR